MAAKKPNPSFQFVMDYLSKHREASYAEVRDAAKKKNFTIFPIVYGRAQAMLGIVESKPRGEGKVARAKPGAGAPSGEAAAPRKRGRPRKTASTPSPVAAVGGSGFALNDIVNHIRELERERDQLRATLDKVRAAVQAEA